MVRGSSVDVCCVGYQYGIVLILIIIIIIQVAKSGSSVGEDVFSYCYNIV